jgi:hypothetical protein
MGTLDSISLNVLLSNPDEASPDLVSGFGYLVLSLPVLSQRFAQLVYSLF